MKTLRRPILVLFRATLIGVMALAAIGCPAKPNTQESHDPKSTVSSQPSPPPAAEEDAGDSGRYTGRVHIVEPKDTLFHLAEKYYGNSNQWRKIWLANRKRLTTPNNLPVGMKLIIP